MNYGSLFKHKGKMMLLTPKEFAVSLTDVFTDWLHGLRDDTARRKIIICTNRIKNGNLGDHHTVGDEISEIRLTYGPGYRLYYTVRGRKIIILLSFSIFGKYNIFAF
jgi:putative addiction module killer protein